ncbi:MAG: PQQ-binding-like beta-propeller repeat protein [Candidatus Saccharimonas sp.]|nr:PQQ-binding-like beta-propeller repeat protein [Planctomycetaceae bacterium]
MKVCRHVAVVFGIGFIATSAVADEWTRFRGSSGNSVSNEAKHPAEWSEDTNVAWKVKIPGRGWSQPVVAGDKVFLTTAVTENEEKPRRFDGGVVLGAKDATKDVYQWKVYCLSLATGKVLWEQTPFEGKPVMPKHRGNTYASETPVTDGERVIAYFGVKGVACYDLSGTPLWSKNLGEYPMRAGWGTGSSPVIVGDAVVIQCDNEQTSFLVGLDKKTGDELWRIARDETSNWSTPYLWKNKLRTELIVAGGKKTRSYDPVTRKVLWEMAGSGRTSVSPVGDDELLYIDSVHAFLGSPGLFAAVRVGASGDISLPDEKTTSGEFVAWSLMYKSYRNSSPLLYGGGLYMVEQISGIVRCFDPKTGKILYQHRLPESMGFTSSPWASNGRVFLLDDSGVTSVIEPGPEFKLISSNRLNDEIFWSSAAISGDQLLLRGQQHLYCIRK